MRVINTSLLGLMWGSNGIIPAYPGVSCCGVLSPLAWETHLFLDTLKVLPEAHSTHCGWSHLPSFRALRILGGILFSSWGFLTLISCLQRIFRPRLHLSCCNCPLVTPWPLSLLFTRKSIITTVVGFTEDLGLVGGGSRGFTAQTRQQPKAEC